MYYVNNPEDILKEVEDAMLHDRNINQVLENVERLIIRQAIKRHGPNQAIYKKIKMPKSTFFLKKKKYFENGLD